MKGNISKFILNGDISIFDVIAKEKYDDFVILSKNKKFANLTELKATTRDHFSFGELRKIFNHLRYEDVGEKRLPKLLFFLR